MAGTLANVNASNWQSEVAASPIPVLVDFWAEWCGPCKAIAPHLEDLAKDLAGKLKIVKVNVDEAPELAGQFGIRSIPTLLLIKGGKVEQQMVGAMTKAALRGKIDPLLG
jgi:thioredoxin 1